MEEPFDVYADQFQVTVGPFGSAVSFGLTPSTPPAQGQPPINKPVGCVRMSVEHLKTMAFLIHRQVLESERNQGVVYPMSRNVLNALRIGPEDWDHFWSSESR